MHAHMHARTQLQCDVHTNKCNVRIEAVKETHRRYVRNARQTLNNMENRQRASVAT